MPLPTLAAWVFCGAGGLMVAGGLVMVFDDPAGFALVAFGLVFIGAGLLARKVFRTPEGKKAVTVSGYEVGITTSQGLAGSRAQAVQIYVDEGAGEAEIEAARRRWLSERWRERPDWVAGRIEEEGARSGNVAYWAAGVSSAVALGLLGAALLGGGFWWWMAVLAAGLAAVLAGSAARLYLHRRKFGPSRLVLQRTPVAPGGRLKGEVRTGVPDVPGAPDGFRLRLECVHRWEERVSGGSDGSRRTQQRRDVLWQVEAAASGHPSAADPTRLAVPVDFELPGDRPPATLGGSDGISWELEVHAPLPGLDYRTSFTLPVLAEGAPVSG